MVEIEIMTGIVGGTVLLLRRMRHKRDLREKEMEIEQDREKRQDEIVKRELEPEPDPPEIVGNPEHLEERIRNEVKADVQQEMMNEMGETMRDFAALEREKKQQWQGPPSLAASPLTSPSRSRPSSARDWEKTAEDHPEIRRLDLENERAVLEIGGFVGVADIDEYHIDLGGGADILSIVFRIGAVSDSPVSCGLTEFELKASRALDVTRSYSKGTGRECLLHYEFRV